MRTADTVSIPEFTEHLKPLNSICGFQVRPGFFNSPGATLLPGGVNFTIHSHSATACRLLLFHRNEKKPFAVLPFPESYRIGFVYSMIVFGLDIEEFEYAYSLDGPYDEKAGLRCRSSDLLLDPYAKAVTGQSQWGTQNDYKRGLRARVVRNNFDWGAAPQINHPLEDLVIYEIHVRGFTQAVSSNVSCPGTFKGIEEKIPYLKMLGINAVELMPVFEFDEMLNARQKDHVLLPDYWGYNTISFFAPNTSYASVSEYNREGSELKHLIKALHDNGIEVILDVVFNHTAEGNEQGPSFCFKGFDNNIYYLLTPEGSYYNFSGCGNTLNCNHPVVQELILECLRYWVTAYRIDGFRFDLASILGRNEDGSPMNQPPLLRSLAFDPILGKTKLIAEAWDAGGLYQVGSFPSWQRFSEWNGKYRDDIRKFLKGDDCLAWDAGQRMAGSPDLYNPKLRGYNASINFITCHDGFTLNDLYTYNEKHNEANGWNNTDGSDQNYSWNCGEEGPVKDPRILSLRKKMICNALTVLLCSRGTPMFLSGDEFCDTRFGNNNPYCQDNQISWMDWSLLEKNKRIFRFCRHMIAFRKEHPVLRTTLPKSSLGFPSVSFHGVCPWKPDFSETSHSICLLFSGKNPETLAEDIVFLAVNAHYETLTLIPPALPNGWCFKIAVNTGCDDLYYPAERMPDAAESVCWGARSVIVLVAVPVI